MERVDKWGAREDIVSESVTVISKDALCIISEGVSREVRDGHLPAHPTMVSLEDVDRRMDRLYKGKRVYDRRSLTCPHTRQWCLHTNKPNSTPADEQHRSMLLVGVYVDRYMGRSPLVIWAYLH